MKNMAIRKAAGEALIPLWKIAEAMGIADSGLSRKLRKELSPEETEKILGIIEEIKNKEGLL